LARNYQPEEDQRIARAAELAARCDLAVIFVGMPEFYESEGHDRPDMNLPGPQDELIQAVVAANPRTIVVLNAGSPVSMPWIDQVPAVLDAYYPGLEGGKAITNVLLGEVNPSGKLSVTYPRRLEDTPAFTNYPGTREVRYGEGIFVGYRHYDARGIEPLFPFGHGLSYTTFEYGPLQVSQPVGPGEPVRVSVAVRNNGKSAGKEVVQLYLQDKQASLPRPPKELKGFTKIELGPGETRTVNFDLDQRALSFFDPYQNQWICEAGEFEILIGSSSRDIRCQETFNLA
jgi:beta-glucosidase